MGNFYSGMSQNTEEIVIRDVVRSVISSQSSGELPYFTRLARTGDPWILWRLRHRRGRDEPLGFGLGEMATLATPVVWITLNEAAKKFGSAAGDGMLAGVGALLRRILHRKPRLATIPPLTEEQRERIRDAVRQELENRKLGNQRAADIANAVFLELSMAPAPTKE
ncbi:hypothetical protein [Catenulispora rubra]|uniref:hypothetical protein n=1 Tax=Catenulispora rubra TaxID=280293 RepID=UPI001891F91E|nr:hypothetical protein [Catenulispora rubra]